MNTDCIDHGRKGFGLGYATAWVHREGVRSTTTLHRKLYYENTGDWPEVVRHKCDNPRCINLTHLIGGTAVENMQDMKERGRAGDCRNFGKHNGRTVLTPDNVREIRRRYTPQCRVHGGSALAREFNIGRTQITRVVTGEHHAEVS